MIARYGGGWRGIKPKVAAEHGAVGCIIYSDPRDDGYFQGEVYPEGRVAPGAGRAARQRHGHADSTRAIRSRRAIGADAGAKRLDRKDAQTITKIPVLPISTATRSRCLPRSRGRSRPRAGAERCRSRITSGPDRRRST